MFTILLHSSKTMRSERADYAPLDSPALRIQAVALAAIIKNHLDSVGDVMKLSPAKAAQVQKMWSEWSLDPATSIPAVDAFIGDIYSGLQVNKWSKDDREYAHKHLRILSGLYGMLRACDGVRPYRLEMGYKLPTGVSMYAFWKDASDKMLSVIPPETSHLINLSSVEYTKALLPYTDLPVITPKFLTVSPKTGEPEFVTVHAKVARGAFARWMIQERVESTDALKDFSDLNYSYDVSRSSENEPVFVCQEFGGIGLSVRLT
jgi:cytoplasmic iron level regulating protein YaaA (DUF328/UPF0246 family)